MSEYDDRLPARSGDNVPSPAFDALPGLVRLAATSWLRTTEWGVVAGVKGARAMLRAATNPREAVEFAQSVVNASTVVADLAKAVSSGVPIPQAVVDVSASISGSQSTAQQNGNASATRQEKIAQSLRDQGEALLMRSRDVWNNDQGHPAYARILTELAPDEGRILLLLLRNGPQPSVDVRTGGPVGMVSSRLVKSGMTMIGPRAGVRYVDQVPSYLHNLFRLGMIWFSREQLPDPMPYQVVEAQPDVLEAMHSVRAHKVVRRSIHLTPFGEDFCKAVLAPSESLADLPLHAAPNLDSDPTGN
ncbi:MAG TPA: Abi-alpha family protein [Nocardioidaceae bacterium]|nr:Abi-alpha family protein [Nocardioidaceae bacterium]